MSACTGLKEPGNSTGGSGADSIIWPSGWTVTRSRSPVRADRQHPLSRRPSPQNAHPHRAGCAATVRQSRMRRPATGRSRAKRGLPQPRDHAGPWPSRQCNARCGQSRRTRCEIDARLYAGDRSPAPLSRRGQPHRCPPDQPGRACPYASCHRDCGVGTARLRRREAKKRRKRPLVVGNCASISSREPPGTRSTRRSHHCRPR